MSSTPLESFFTSRASELNATYRPFAEIEGCSLSPSASLPFDFTLTRSSLRLLRFQTKTSASVPLSFLMNDPSESKATRLPCWVMLGSSLSVLISCPFGLTLTRTVLALAKAPWASVAMPTMDARTTTTASVVLLATCMRRGYRLLTDFQQALGVNSLTRVQRI